jgi:hypothetical protein
MQIIEQIGYFLKNSKLCYLLLLHVKRKTSDLKNEGIKISTFSTPKKIITL